MDISEIKDRAIDFKEQLDAQKTSLAPKAFGWYPYGSLNNFYVLDQLLTGKHRRLLDLIGNGATVDIGCADGDLAFFLETLGCRVHVVDNGPTNFNGLQGARLLKEQLQSRVEIHEVDLDAQFQLPQTESYNLAFFLGILYHLKNPYYVLEALAKQARYSLISTRIAKYTSRDAKPGARLAKLFGDKRLNIAEVPVAYLLDELECNNDSTNFWIFSDAGLRRILKRTGWEVCDFITVGNTANSDPASGEGDERAFCLVKSRFFA